VTSLVIVARNRPDLFEQLANRFAREPHVRVMFDRRQGIATTSDGERRRAEEAANERLRTEGFVIVTAQ
jgi:hypothetical protein